MILFPFPDSGFRILCFSAAQYIIQRDLLSNDDMIYTYVNMYITFVTPVMDVRNSDQVWNGCRK